MNNWPWPTKYIRELLIEALDSISLKEVLQDNEDLKEARTRLSNGMEWREQVSQVIDFCEGEEKELTLLKDVVTKNPKKCEVVANKNNLPPLLAMAAASKTKSLMSEDDLIDQLLTIDFDPHIKVWNYVIPITETAAFLVHGEPECGHTVLVYRLAQEIPNWPTAKKVLIDASGSGGKMDVIWRKIATCFVDDATAPKQDILDALCDHLRTKNVVIFVHGAEVLAQMQTLSQWIDEFWGAAVQRVRAPEFQKTRQEKTYLIMFLVDRGGNSPACGTRLMEWSLQTIEGWTYDDVCNDYESTTPVCLPPADRFDQKKLTDWLQNRTTPKSLPIRSKIAVLRLLNKTANGLPELVYREICLLDHHRWEDDVFSRRLRDVT